MPSSFHKRIIIIGATSGIGRALAEHYAKTGCRVGISGRREYLLAAIHEHFPNHIVTECFDVQGSDNIQHMQSLIEKTGGMDILIYNAGFGDPSQTLDWHIEKTTYETNVKGFLEIVHFAFNFFVQQGHGQIAATSSVAANRGNGLAPAYSASKAFMSVYMEGLLMKAAKMKVNIAITDIQPGFIASKTAKNKVFWVTPVDKAVQQMAKGIDKKKFRVYISRRWRIIAWIMKRAPSFVWHKL
jgi:Short-chain dehydrogenases of various substrate specificities